MAQSTKNYQYLTKAIPMPDGRRKYIRAKTQEELDAKVQELLKLQSVGVDISNDMYSSRPSRYSRIRRSRSWRRGLLWNKKLILRKLIKL